MVPWGVLEHPRVLDQCSILDSCQCGTGRDLHHFLNWGFAASNPEQALGEMETNLLSSYIESQFLWSIVYISGISVENHVPETNSTDDVDIMGPIVVLVDMRARLHQELFPSFRRISTRRLVFNNEPVVEVALSLLRFSSIQTGLYRPYNNCFGFILLNVAFRSHKWFVVDDPSKPLAMDDFIARKDLFSHVVPCPQCPRRDTDTIRLENGIWQPLTSKVFPITYGRRIPVSTRLAIRHSGKQYRDRHHVVHRLLKIWTWKYRKFLGHFAIQQTIEHCEAPKGET